MAEATRILLDAHDSYEDARAGGATLAEAAAKLNLKVVTVEAVDRQALRPDGTIVNDLPESPELLKQAFETEVGIENPAINIGSTGYVFYEVQGVTPARDRTLDEVHDKVVADWKAAEAEKRLDAKAAELAKQVKDGAALDAIAAELKLEKQTKRGVKREADDADFGKEGVAAMFARGRRRHGHGAVAGRRRAHHLQGRRSVRAGRRRRRIRCPRTRASRSPPGFPTTCSTSWWRGCRANMA